MLAAAGNRKRPPGQTSRRILIVPRTERVFWRNATCTVWVGYNDAGELEFHGDESAYMGGEGHNYEYWITVPADQFDRLRATLGADPGADVVDVVSAHVDKIKVRGERSWLDDHGIGRGFRLLLVSVAMASLGSGSRPLLAVVAVSTLSRGVLAGCRRPRRIPSLRRLHPQRPRALRLHASRTPVAPACGDGQALLAGMSTRDKLAQLLMVGVTDAADARAVVDTHHVGGAHDRQLDRPVDGAGRTARRDLPLLPAHCRWP